jgi:predicted regulator of Ras-like GTPase activity (Roadblock/LC7/MglB family)
MMTPVVWAWLLSLSGAALFFGAGSVFALSRSALRSSRERQRRDRERAELDRALRAVLAERERDRGTLAAAMSERDRLQAAQAAVEKSAREANARADQAWREVADLVEQMRSKRKALPSERRVVLDAGAGGDALRTILDKETRGNGFAGAVIADGLGLVVAATGEYGDALAAYGAFLAGVGAKTRDALPLSELRQVIVQDDHDMTLTVRPIASADDNLALVTLAAGRRNGAPANTYLER